MREHPGPTRRSQLLDINKRVFDHRARPAATDGGGGTGAPPPPRLMAGGRRLRRSPCGRRRAGWSKILIPHHLKSTLNIHISTVRFHKYWTSCVVGTSAHPAHTRTHRPNQNATQLMLLNRLVRCVGWYEMFAV